MNRLLALFVATFLFASLSAQAQTPIILEAEAAPGMRPDPTFAGAIVFEESMGTLEYQAPRSLPAGPMWVLILARQQAGATSPSQLLVSTETQPSMTVDVRSATTPPGFAYVRVAGRSDGQKRPRVVLSVKGPSIAIDKIEFHPGSTASLPQITPVKPGQVFILSTGSKTADAEAAAIHERLSRIKPGIPGPVQKTLTATPNQGDLVVVCCDQWSDAAALKWLPLWSDQLASASSPWGYKSSGVLGIWAALGLRPGGAQVLQDSMLRNLLATGSLPASAADANDYESVELSSPDDASMRSLAVPDQAVQSASIPSPWNQPKVPADWRPTLAQGDYFVAALGHWLYRLPEWHLNESERNAYGWQFCNWAALTEAYLKKAASSATPSAEPVVLARALLVAAQVFAEQPAAATWKATAEGILARAQKELLADSMKERLAAARALQYYAVQSNARVLTLNPLLQGISALAIGPGKNIRGLEGENVSLGPEDLRGVPIRPAQSTTLQITRLPLQSPTLLKAAPQGFDKLIIAKDEASVIIDGISTGNVDNAGSIARFTAADRLWIKPSEPNAVNGLSAKIGDAPVKFLPRAEIESTLSGTSNALAVVQRKSEKGDVWRPAVFFLAKSSSLVLLDEVRVKGAGPLTIQPALNFSGTTRAESPHVMLVEQSGSTVKGYALSHEWGQAWSAKAIPAEPVFLRSAVVPANAPAPEALAVPGLRLGKDTAVFFGNVDAAEFKLQARAAIITPEEVLLSGVTRLDLNSPVLESTQPLEVVLTSAGLEITSAQSATAVLHSPIEIKAGAQIPLPAGKTTIPLLPEQIAAFYGALAKAIAQLPAGEFGPASEARPQAASLPGKLSLERSIACPEPVTAATAIPTATDDLVLLATEKGKLFLAGKDGATKSFADLGRPIVAVQAVFYGADKYDVVAATDDGTLQRLNAKGELLGSIPLQAKISRLEPFDVEQDGQEELAVLSESGLVVIDPLGQIAWRYSIEQPLSIDFADFGSGRTSAVLGTKSQRYVVQFNDDGTHKAITLDSASAVTAVATIDVTADGTPEAVFGTESGLLSAVNVRTQQVLWEHSTGVNAVQAVCASGDPKSPVLIGSSGKFIEKMPGAVGVTPLDGAVEKILPLELPLGETLFAGFAILTDKPSIYLLTGEGNVHARTVLDEGVVEMLATDQLTVVTGKGIRVYALGE